MAEVVVSEEIILELKASHLTVECAISVDPLMEAMQSIVR